MKNALIIINLMAALWLVFWSPAMPKAADSQIRRQVLELCNAGIIDTNALHAHYPDQAYPERKLSLSLSHSQGYFYFFIWPAALLAMLNAVGIGLLWRKHKK